MMEQKMMDEFNQKVATALDLTSAEVDRLIKFQFSEFKEATHTCSTLELTEIGSYSINKKHYYKELKKREKMIEAYTKQLGSVEEGRKKKSLEAKLKTAQADYDFLKDKIKEDGAKMESNIGRVEESSDATQGA